MFGMRWFCCVAITLSLVCLSKATTEPLPELVPKEKRELKQAAEITEVSDNVNALLDVDAGAEHDSDSDSPTNRVARQFGFRRRGFGGRRFYGGFRPYGGYYRPPYYRPPFYRPPFYRPPFYRPPFYYRPYYGFGPGFYG